MATKSAINLWPAVFQPLGDHIISILSFCNTQNHKGFAFVVLYQLNYPKTIKTYLYFYRKTNQQLFFFSDGMK